MARPRPPAWPAVSIAEAHAALGRPGSPFEIEEITIRGARQTVWRLLPPTLAAVLEAARAYGDREALVYEDERVTYAGLVRAAYAFAHELASQGVQPGDRVALALRNLPEWVAAFYGAAAAGAIVAPLNAWWTARELVFALNDSGAKAVVVDGERQARLAARLGDCPALARIYVARSAEALADPRAVRLEAVLGAPGSWQELADAPAPAVRIEADDPATLFYTSGTTGEPRGVLASHRAANGNIFASASAFARHALRRGEPAPEAFPAGPPRTALVAIPFFHVTGALATLNANLFAGGKLVLMRKWDPARAFQLIEAEQVNTAGGVPAIAWDLAEHPARAGHDLSSLRTINYGGAPAAPELVRRLAETFPGVLLSQGWGMTETCGGAAYNGGEDYLARPASCGPAVMTAELQVRDPQDGRTVLPAGEVGELWCKGPMTAIGYWNRPEETARTFVGGWVRTGDLARLDADGFCFVVDRVKDVVIRGGENIYGVEVENALHEHPAVLEAAVVGAPHHVLGEEPVAAVALKPGARASEAELRAHAAERLAAFKVPVRVRIWEGPLPRNPSGKILKAEIRRALAAAGEA